MAQLVVTLDNSSSISLVKKAIGLLRGVRKVTVVKQTKSKKPTLAKGELTDVPEDIRSLVGLASGISVDEIEADDRLSYLMNK